ncbi:MULTISPECIES: hypothetical protein [unclassified Novosphingobium]|uniref:hypothetical protein n=1 Tax=unclassified Novosphingobium TaxID=2644732 RepID=UPI001358D239|nr:MULTISPECIES: hypothetical protein [unclassified Novosphingobium]
MKIERCTCGKMPSFVCVQIAEDAVESQYVCQIGTRIPGGGTSLGGCGKQGPEVEDAYSDRETAAHSWNVMIRSERRSKAA